MHRGSRRNEKRLKINEILGTIAPLGPKVESEEK
jgi:hypothetical protein